MTSLDHNILEESGQKLIRMWTKGVPVEDKALQQLRNVASMPFIFKHVAVMPDVHWGMGATVGSVIASKGAIIPAAVGVDIGCGMMAVRTTLHANDMPDNLHAIRSAIEASVPHGRSDNGGVNDIGAHREPIAAPEQLVKRLKHITDTHQKISRAASRAWNHCGTLGTGNHFIELCLDEDQRVWVMLHSGSRGIGNAIGQHFINLAKEDMKRWFINLPDQDLAYIPDGSKLFGEYRFALEWAQEFALLNRKTMMDATLQAIERVLCSPIDSDEMAVNCHHNYVSWEKHFGEHVMVTRKGAVKAGLGDLGIIPGSMGAKSFIVAGKSNRYSFCSCSHGAGRSMSRTEAKRRFTLEDHAKATEGVECRKDEDVIDETPAAYKSIDAVMAAQSSLVEIVHTLKQIICVKG